MVLPPPTPPVKPPEPGTAGIRRDEGRRAEAGRELRAVSDEARKYNYLAYELQARLLLAEVEMKSGRALAGRAHLESLRSAAHNKGFGLIADQAAAALNEVKQ